MFCPKCSRPQISDHVRFCSGCGFQLNVVKALLVADDDSSSRTAEPVAAHPGRRKRDMILGASVMCLFALHSVWTTEEFSLDWQYTSLIIKCLILCVLINIVPLIRDFFFAYAKRNNSSSAKMLSGLMMRFTDREQNPALPDSYYRPAADYFNDRPNTGELVAPRSVTEDMTDLLRKS